MIAAREFQSAAEMQEYYKGLKARLYAPPRPQIAITQPEMQPEPPPRAKPIAVMRVPDIKPYIAQIRGDISGRGRTILTDTANKYGLTVADVVGKSRWLLPVLARAEVCWRGRHDLGWSLSQIGNLVERDHTTVLNCIRRHDARLRGRDPDTLHFRISDKSYALSVEQAAKINHMSRSGLIDRQIAGELDLPESNVRWAVSCRLGHKDKRS